MVIDECVECKGPEDFRGIKVCEYNGQILEGQSKYAILDEGLHLVRVCLKYYGSEEKVLNELGPLNEEGSVVEMDKSLQAPSFLNKTYYALFK